MTLPDVETFTSKYRASAHIREVVAEFAKVLKQVDEAMEPERLIQELIAGLYTGAKHVEFNRRGIEVKAKEVAIPLESLSSGEKQLLRILVETVVADKDSILIDEPELSMHVDWQHQLVDAMRIVNPAVQIILATHSPEVMAELSESSIFQL
jgi:predicted ATPase